MQAAVVDASVALKWMLPEPGSDQAITLQGLPLYAPDLLLAECGNVLWVNVRRERLTKSEAEDCFEGLSNAPIIWSATGGLAAEATALALDLDHPVYDCVYLALALDIETPLVTADQKLISAARRESALQDLIVPLDALS